MMKIAGGDYFPMRHAQNDLLMITFMDVNRNASRIIKQVLILFNI